MLFDAIRRRRQEKADSQQAWLARWQSLVPEENRNVPVTVEGQTRIAYIQINQFVVMLQDGLLMKAHFFDVCEFFQKAGYHVVWLMRCVQDVEGGYLKLVKMEDGGARCRWKWRKPTTNFGRWTSDNYSVTILIQHRQVRRRSRILAPAGCACCSASPGPRATTIRRWSPAGQSFLQPASPLLQKNCCTG